MSNMTSAISPTEPLTTHLLSLQAPRPYSAATEHLFLTAAGDGNLPDELTSLYLSQDRPYAAHAYPAFIGWLLAAQRNQRIVRVLSDALQNVGREVGFFDETAKAFGPQQSDSWRELKATRDFTAEMAHIGTHGRIEDGLVFLWAMERVRILDAWKYVGCLKSTHPHERGTTPAVAALVSNWTNPISLDISSGSTVWQRAESIWARVIEIEEAFWPVQSLGSAVTCRSQMTRI
ncbi:heme oxygenase-like protein [Laetiporus sulphureus 93-53]|uniref:Heme oxygenase-like protein n=1 Tax=Laetiporus sulphureus 93-53 TaxID=1314785 RepID=A0A165HSW1_9APHY|nr:heme oxygenase-like protein [Laetiporus sulphureus 93-53]KZT12141.1 heme oxygenase-like protein [Laetiporus sulphureus 93-53]